MPEACLCLCSTVNGVVWKEGLSKYRRIPKLKFNDAELCFCCHQFFHSVIHNVLDTTALKLKIFQLFQPTNLSLFCLPRAFSKLGFTCAPSSVFSRNTHSYPASMAIVQVNLRGITADYLTLDASNGTHTSKDLFNQQPPRVRRFFRVTLCVVPATELPTE